MKWILTVILIAILGTLLSTFLPWWSVAIAAVIVAMFMGMKAGSSFLAGLLGGALMWGAHSAVVHIHTQGILSDKMAPIFGLPSGLSLLVVTTLIAALVAGCGAWAGSEIRRAIS